MLSDQVVDGADVPLVLLETHHPEGVAFWIEQAGWHAAPEDAARRLVAPDLRQTERDDEYICVEQDAPGVAPGPLGIMEDRSLGAVPIFALVMLPVERPPELLQDREGVHQPIAHIDDVRGTLGVAVEHVEIARVEPLADVPGETAAEGGDPRLRVDQRFRRQPAPQHAVGHHRSRRQILVQGIEVAVLASVPGAAGSRWTAFIHDVEAALGRRIGARTLGRHGSLRCKAPSLATAARLRKHQVSLGPDEADSTPRPARR